MGMCWSSRDCSTPICARPSAPPPSSATPILSLVPEPAGWFAFCATAVENRNRQKPMATKDENLCVRMALLVLVESARLLRRPQQGYICSWELNRYLWTTETSQAG